MNIDSEVQTEITVYSLSLRGTFLENARRQGPAGRISGPLDQTIRAATHHNVTKESIGLRA